MNTQTHLRWVHICWICMPLYRRKYMERLHCASSAFGVYIRFIYIITRFLCTFNGRHPCEKLLFMLLRSPRITYHRNSQLPTMAKLLCGIASVCGYIWCQRRRSVYGTDRVVCAFRSCLLYNSNRPIIGNDMGALWAFWLYATDVDLNRGWVLLSRCAWNILFKSTFSACECAYISSYICSKCTFTWRNGCVLSIYGA